LPFSAAPRATYILLHRQRLQVFDRLQAELEVVKDGFLRGDVSIEDLGQE
jgi:hypothetical protein